MGRAYEYRKASKEARWDKMSKIFPKLGKNITIAAKEGGPDPEMNPKLRTAIQNAKAQNMPKDNIDAAIKRALGKDADAYSEINYEGKGPHGSLIYVECATDNNTRTVANIKVIFNKNGGSVSPSGSLEFMFKRKAVFQFEKTDAINPEDLELELIDAGLDELEVFEDSVFVYADYTNFGNMAKALEDMKISVKKANLQRIPTNPIEFTEEQMIDIEKLIDKLEEDDDVQAVYANIL
jgi:YebC/PmpR family DNA-binding regulatory protein